MKNLDEVRRRTISGVVSYGIRTGFLYVIAVVATGMLGAFLSPAEFGIYYIVLSVVGLFTFLSDVGLAAALIQKKEEPTLSDLRTTFTIQQGLAFLIFFLTIGLTPFWRRYSGLDSQGLELLYVLAFSFVLASFKTIPSVILERKLLFNKLVIPQMVEQLLFYSIAVLMAWKGYGVRSFTVAVLARSIGGVVIMYMIQSWSIGIQITRDSLRTLLSFGVKFQVNDLLARLKDDLFVVVISRFLTATEMGYLGWAKRWSMFPYQFSVQNVIAITFPTYSRLQNHTELLTRALEKSLYFIALMIFPILVGMSVLAEPAIQLVPAYEKWIPALPLLYFYCLNIGFAALANPMINVMNAVGKIDVTLRLMMLMTIATYVLSPIGYRWFGLVGIAMASAVVALLSMGIYFHIRRSLPLKLWSQIKDALLGSLVMGGVLFGLNSRWEQSVWHLMSGVGLGMLIYLLVVNLLGGGRLLQEIDSLKHTKPSKKAE